MNILHALVLMPIIVFTAQTSLAETVKNDPPALEEKNSMPNATYTNKYLGPQIEVTRDSVSLTQGYDKNLKNNLKKNASPAVIKDKGRIKPVEDSR